MIGSDEKFEDASGSDTNAGSSESGGMDYFVRCIKLFICGQCIINVFLTLPYSLKLIGESGIDVALDASEKIAGAVAPIAMGPVKGAILSTGIKTVRGFVDRIQRGNSSANNDGIHTNRSFAKYSYKLPTYLHVVKTIRNNTISKSILIFILDFHPDGRMRPYCTLTFVWNTWKL